MKKYWLLKSEAACYSIDDLKRDKKVPWTGIRNYQARNFMRDEMQAGDLCLFYHSSSEPTAVAGVCEVVSAPHADETAFDPKDEHFDPKSKPENPTWIAVDIKFIKKFKESVSLHRIKIDPKFAGMMLIQKGSRLSVQPISKKHFDEVVKLGE